MMSRCKVWFALWVVLLVNFFAGDAIAITTNVTVTSSAFSPSALTVGPGDTIVFTAAGSGFHKLLLDGADVFGGANIVSGQSLSRVFSTEGTFIMTKERSGGSCVITVFQPENAAPTVAITNLALSVAIPLGSNVVVSARAEDENGSIRRVLFLYGAGTNLSAVTNVIATSTAAPHTITWTNNVPGRYTLRARAFDNEEVFANSTRVNLSLYTPFTNTLPVLTNIAGVDNLVFRFNSNTGLLYVVDASTNLIDWTPIVTNVATNSVIEVLDTNRFSLTNRFYRVRLVP